MYMYEDFSQKTSVTMTFILLTPKTDMEHLQVTDINTSKLDTIWGGDSSIIMWKWKGKGFQQKIFVPPPPTHFFYP